MDYFRLKLDRAEQAGVHRVFQRSENKKTFHLTIEANFRKYVLEELFIPSPRIYMEFHD